MRTIYVESAKLSALTKSRRPTSCQIARPEDVQDSLKAPKPRLYEEEARPADPARGLTVLPEERVLRRRFVGEQTVIRMVDAYVKPNKPPYQPPRVKPDSLSTIEYCQRTAKRLGSKFEQQARGTGRRLSKKQLLAEFEASNELHRRIAPAVARWNKIK